MMTTAEWSADAINILLIVLIVCVFVLGIFAVKGFVGERMLRKQSIWFASVFGFLFMAYLVLHVIADLNVLADWDALSGLREILPADWAQIFLVLGLVAGTGFYALMAFRQADASVKMTKQMVKPRLAPGLYLEGSFFEGRRVKFNAIVNNDGEGSAYDAELWIEDDSTPPSKLLSRGHKTAVLRKGDSTGWLDPPPYLDFPHSDRVQRRFFVIKYRDIDGEHEIRQPFVLETGEGDKPYARLESISRKIIREIYLEDELP